jgi:DNA primase
MNNLLLIELNKILGTGKATARNNFAYSCPLCKHKSKLEINLDETSAYYQNYNCWVCGLKGKNLISLLNNINRKDLIVDLAIYNKNKVTHSKVTKKQDAIELPREFISFLEMKGDDLVGKKALKYLLKRKITREDILKYNIGYCNKGKYSDRIIIPSYDSNEKLNYFVARSINDNYFKYLNPPTPKDIIPFESQINWNLPIILCEGTFDAIAIKRNAIPLLGSNSIPTPLMKKIVTSKVNKIYLALDKDKEAMKHTIKFCETLLNIGKEVYWIEISEKDPSQLGFEKFTLLSHNTLPLTFSKLLTMKMQ